ncbi:TonB-dependent receptor [Ancylomarina longa]|uniref:TonB-dependent receptor n=2 Tax=Ancylomarina longa TaxID=2487017 RepID=A0A434AZ99_9BACT|nr:TonB-dependent receptor [Ancylomarina longa]
MVIETFLQITMQKRNCIISLILILVLGIQTNLSANTTQFYQTIRGKIIDTESKQSLIGANVVILNSNPFIGTASDINGNFRLDKVPVGRINLQITCLGYEPKIITNIEVGSAKEVILNIELIESVTKIGEIKVYPKTAKHETLNKMAVVSGQAFTVEETSRYAGAINDPARMVSGYAGVTGDAEGTNEIIVRGNSPKGIQWRLEGIEIPNPNHFADEGTTGGAISALNSFMLCKSDFYSGAFTAEYGNAYSGIFDIKLRSGNNAKHENSFALSSVGVDFSLEGPIHKNYSGSYLINYRYSSLGLLDKLGIMSFDGVPKYQDGSFKIVLPSQKTGTFTFWGLLGKSSIDAVEKTDDESLKLGEYQLNSNLGIIGLSNLLPVGKKSYLKNTIAWSANKIQNKSKLLGDNNSMFVAVNENYQKSYLKYVSTFNTKLNAKHSLKIGLVYTNLSYNVKNINDLKNSGISTVSLNSDGSSQLFQSFVSWKYRITSNLSVISGVHSTYFQLNKDYSIEPRLGMKFQFLPNQSISLGIGMHSKIESISTYFVQLTDAKNNIYTPNSDLKMSKARHYVLGYNNQLGRNLHLKIEAYYQDLYNLAVENNPNSRIVLQDLNSGLAKYDFVNKGRGKNYGLELTLERFFHNNFYYLLTGSLYEAKFTALDGVERNSRYNGKFAANILIGKEFKTSSKGQNTLGLNGKISFRGGQYYTPVDLKKSQDAGETIYTDNSSFSKRGDNIFILNASVNYKINHKKTQHEFKLEIQNASNHKAKIMERYNEATHLIEDADQLSLLPVLSYTLHF